MVVLRQSRRNARVPRAASSLQLDIHVIRCRAFRKEAALLAGLDHARLGAVFFMDVDGSIHRHSLKTSSRICFDDL